MKRRALLAVFLAVALAALAACADEPLPGGGDETRYRTDAFVLEDASHGPELCLGGVAESLPPQCGGIPLAGWNWDEVDGEDSASGARWGQFEVVGTYDGDTFTVLEAGPASDEGPRADPIVWTRCPEPEGGWTSPDPSMAGQEALDAVRPVVEDEEDYAGHWIDYLEETGEGPIEPGAVILNAAFNGDIERHTAEIRTVWGGPLCVVEHERTLSDLERIQHEVTDGGIGEGVGLETTWSSVDIVTNTVQFGVVLVTAEAEAALAERFGEGAVELFPALSPVQD